MKKSVFWVSLSVISVNVWGMNLNNIPLENKQNVAPFSQINPCFQFYNPLSSDFNAEFGQDSSSEIPCSLAPYTAGSNSQLCDHLNPVTDSNQNFFLQMHMQSMQLAGQYIEQTNEKAKQLSGEIKRLKQIVFQQNLQIQALESAKSSTENPSNNSENQQDLESLFTQFIEPSAMVDSISSYPEVSGKTQDEQVSEGNSNYIQQAEDFSLSPNLQKAEDDLSSQLKELKVKVENLKKQQKTDSEEIESLKKQLEKTKNDYSLLEQNKDEKIRKLQQLIETLKQKEKDSLRQIRELQKTIKEQKKSFEQTLNDTINGAQLSVINAEKTAKESIGSLEKQLEKANGEIKSLRKQSEEVNSEIESQKKQLEKTKNNYSLLEQNKDQEIQKLQQIIETLKQKEKDSLQAKQELNDKINILEQSENQKDQEIEKLRQQLKEARDERNRQSNEIEDNSEIEEELNRKRKRSDFENESEEINPERFSSVPPLKVRKKLSKALEESDIGKLISLVRDYPQLVAEQDDSGWTPLIKIISDKKINKQDKYFTVEALLKANKKDFSNHMKSRNTMINQQVSSGSSALSMAVIQGDYEIVNLLLEYGADPNISDNQGWSPLMIAVKEGYKDIVKILLDHKADPNNQDDKKWRNPLMLAVERGYKDIAKILLDHKANPDDQNGSGWTPLMIISEKEVEASRVDNDTGMINRKLKDEVSALNLIEKKYSEIANLLLKYGADPDIQNSGGWSSLIYAADRGHPEIVKTLIEYGADLYLETTQGYNALTRAMLSKKIKLGEVREDIIEMIIEADPKIITHENAKGYSALSTATYRKLAGIKKLLLKHKKSWDLLCIDDC